jgi:hypothetical protein
MFTLARAVIDITAPMAAFNASMAHVGRTMQQMRTSMAVPIGLAVGAGVGGIALGLSRAIAASTDFAEASSKARQVLGPDFAAVGAMADDMAARFGIVRSVALDAAANFAQMGQGMGMAGGEAAQFSMHFAKLAQDLQSFNNIPTYEQALIKLQGALAGETESLGRLGVNVREANVLEYARARGIARTSEELTEQQKVMIRANIITASLSKVSGDMERTQGDLANRTRRFSGTLTNAFESLGTAMMPALKAIMGALNESATAFAGWVEANKAAIGSFALAAVEMGGGFLATMGSVISGLNQAGVAFAQWVADSAMFRAAVAGINAAYAGMRAVGTETMTALGVIWRNWAQIVAEAFIRAKQAIFNLMDAFEWLGRSMASLARWIADNWAAIIIDSIKAIGVSVMNLVKNLTNLGSAIGTFAGDPTRGFEFKWTPLLDGFKATMKELPKIARPVFTDMQGEIDALRNQVAGNEAEAAVAAAGGPQARKAAANAVRAARAGFDVPAGKGSPGKAEFVGLAEFAKKIQTGAMGKDKVGDQQLSVARQSLIALGRIDQAVRRPQVAVAVGPA